MKKRIIAATIVIILLAGAMTFWLAGRSATPDNRITLHGNVDIRQVALAFSEPGRVKQLNAEEGERVQAGQLLALLDTDALQIQLKQASARLAAQQQAVQEQQAGSRPEEITQGRAQLAIAETQLRKAGDDLLRIQRIAASTDKKGISQQELDAARSNQQIAAAQLKERQAHLALLLHGVRPEQRQATLAQLGALNADVELLQYRLSQGELRAPVNAVIRARLLEPGDMANPQKAVFTLALDTPKWVRVWLSETDLGRVKTGMSAQVVSDSFPDQTVSGTVSYISSVAEFTPKSVQTAELRTSLVYEVRVRVEDPQDRLRMGQPATVTIDAGNTHE